MTLLASTRMFETTLSELNGVPTEVRGVTAGRGLGQWNLK